MRKVHFKETEIVRVLKKVEGRRQVKEVCREFRITTWSAPRTLDQSYVRFSSI